MENDLMNKLMIYDSFLKLEINKIKEGSIGLQRTKRYRDNIPQIMLEDKFMEKKIQLEGLQNKFYEIFPEIKNYSESKKQ